MRRCLIAGLLTFAVGPAAAAQAAPIRHTVTAGAHKLALWEKRAAKPTRAILLLHGRTWSGLPDFDLQVPGEQRSLMDALVAKGYAVYALDLPGYGASPRDASGWNTPESAMADLTAKLLLCGHRCRYSEKSDDTLDELPIAPEFTIHFLEATQTQ